MRNDSSGERMCRVLKDGQCVAEKSELIKTRPEMMLQLIRISQPYEFRMNPLCMDII